VNWHEVIDERSLEMHQVVAFSLRSFQRATGRQTARTIRFSHSVTRLEWIIGSAKPLDRSASLERVRSAQSLRATT